MPKPLALRAFLIAGLLILSTAALLGAYPISPAPLWELVAEAERIVLAEVVAVEPIEDGDEDRWDSAEAILWVEETWKGEHRTDLRVPYPTSLLCPAPPRYLEGETVLAFLTWHEGQWRTVSLSYGTLYPRGEEVDAFRDLVRRAIELQQDEKLPRTARIDWLVDAASHPGTRWHGLYELHPEGDEIHAFYDREERPWAGSKLRRAHLERLAAGFVAAPTVDRTAPMMLALLAGYESAAVDRAAVSVVEAVLRLDAHPWWLNDALVLVFGRYRDKDPTRRLILPENPWEKVDAAVVHGVWATARRELGIPRVEPAEIPDDAVRGVGDKTPS